MILQPFPRLVGPILEPPFRRGETRVDEAFREVELSAVAQILGEALQDVEEHARPPPLLKSTMAGLLRRIAVR
jgi:hypothetical protein